MKKIVIAALGEDVHAAGIYRFSSIAREEGYEVVNLGSAISVETMLDEVEKQDPDLVAVRLSAESGRGFSDFKAVCFRPGRTGTQKRATLCLWRNRRDLSGCRRIGVV